MSNPECTKCDLAKQIAECGPDLEKITEVPVPRHAWSDVAICPDADCDRAFLFIRKEPNDE